jgi:hypothetical protein
MNLYIETENGQTKNHPAYKEHLIQAFGQIPEQWEPFVRVEEPVLEEHQVFDEPRVTYEKINGVWTDVFHIRDMTTEEKIAKKQKLISECRLAWASYPESENFSAWVLNEELMQHEPPIPRPAADQAKLDAGIYTLWCGADNNWKDAPVKPVNEAEYTFDFYAWTWVTYASLIPRPRPVRAKLEVGIFTFWCHAENCWKDTPAKPVDANQYTFNFSAWDWVQVVN